jgi:hypothetical protein
MVGPVHGIPGTNFATELPEKEADLEAVGEIQRKAKYSQTREFKEFKEKIDRKIEFYQQYLPGGVAPESIPEAERAKYWAVASIIIKEFKEILGEYEMAKELVAENAKR